MFFVRHRIQLCKYYFFRNFYEHYRFYIFAFDSITYKRFNLQSMLFDIRWLRSYYCRDKVYPAQCLFSSCSKYVRYNRHQNIATPGMAIKAAIAKAAFTILPFSIETELRLKYFMYTILIEVWGLSFVLSLAVYSSRNRYNANFESDGSIYYQLYRNIYL